MDRLDDLFRCEQYGMLAHRECLRRQLEPPPVDEPPRGGLRVVDERACGAGCAQGRIVRERLATPILRVVRRRAPAPERNVVRIDRRRTVAAQTVRARGDAGRRWPAVGAASDEYLVEAALELAGRIERLRAETDRRLGTLGGALAALRAALDE